MPSLTELHREAANITSEMKAVEDAHAKRMEGLSAKRGECRRTIKLMESALDLEQITLAQSLIYVRGSFAKAGDDREFARSKAISSLVNEAGAELWSRYMGTKSYDRWHGQWVNPEYGMGPTHGCVIFEIGLRADVRKARPRGSLTPEEVEACLYYLGAIETIQKATEEAARATG